MRAYCSLLPVPVVGCIGTVGHFHSWADNEMQQLNQVVSLAPNYHDFCETHRSLLPSFVQLLHP